MKKNAKIAMGIALCVFAAGLTSCATTSVPGMVDNSKYDQVSGGLYSKVVSVGQIENSTPENSVLVYGLPAEAGAKFWYVDEKNGWEATVESEFMKLVLPPVHKGAKLTLKQGGFFVHESTGYYRDALGRQTYTVTDTWYPVTNDEWNINVPADKSLYFMGYHSILMPGVDTFEGMQVAAAKQKSEGNIVMGFPKTQEEYDAMMKKTEINLLKKILKQYKGTAWESVINERIAELSAK